MQFPIHRETTVLSPKIDERSSLLSIHGRTAEITIKYKYLAIVAYAYLLIPILIFSLTWLRWPVAVGSILLLAIGFVFLLRSDYLSHTGELVLPIRAVLLIGLVFLLWHWLSGQGGFFFQTEDFHARNALFRDLIDFQWPIVYPQTGNALVYYIMHWIIPALIGKFTGWVGGNIALLVWTYMGTMIAYLLVVYVCKARTINQVLLVGILFILWGGLNSVGLEILKVFRQASANIRITDEWLDEVYGTGRYGYQYSGNDTLLSWVFNQTIAPWIAVPLFLENRKVRNYAFLGLCIYPYAPLPFTGLAILMIASAIQIGISRLRSKQALVFLRETFSIPNLTAILSVFIIFTLYFSNNTSGQKIGWYAQPDEWEGL